MPCRSEIEPFERSLKDRGVRITDLSDAAQSASYSGDNSQIFAFGSLAEGYGNSASDIDLCEIGSDARHSERHGLKRTVRSGSFEFDLLYLDRSRTCTLIDELRAQSYKPVKFRDIATRFGAADRRFLHIVATGIPLVGSHPSQIAAPPLNEAEVSLQALAHARYHIHNKQIDLFGMLAERDFQSAYLVLLNLIGHLADLVAAVQGSSDPIEKWRMRKLARLSAQWHDRLIGVVPASRPQHIFRELYLAASQFLRTTHMDAIFHTLAFARQALLATDFAFEGMSSGLKITCEWRSEAKPYDPMPDLPIDSAIFVSASTARLVSLLEPLRFIDCHAEDAVLLTLFDARFSTTEATDWAAEMHGDQGGAKLMQLEEMAQKAGLLVRPSIGVTAPCSSKNT